MVEEMDDDDDDLGVTQLPPDDNNDDEAREGQVGQAPPEGQAQIESQGKEIKVVQPREKVKETMKVGDRWQEEPEVTETVAMEIVMEMAMVVQMEMMAAMMEGKKTMKKKTKM